MEGFEVFEKSRKRSSEAPGPRTTVALNGNITVNEEALALFGDRRPGFVQLLFNKATQVVALKPTDEDDSNAYKLRESANTKSRTVGAKSFFTHYGIELARANYPTANLGEAVAFSLNPDAPLTPAGAASGGTNKKK